MFHNLDYPGRQALADSMKTIDVDEGQIIARHGEPGKRPPLVEAALVAWTGVSRSEDRADWMEPGGHPNQDGLAGGEDN